MVICLERGADLHMAQLMPLPLTVSFFSKIQIGFSFLVPAHLDSPGKRAVKRVRVCVCFTDLCFHTYSRLRHTHTHTRLTALCPGLPGWAGTRKAASVPQIIQTNTLQPLYRSCKWQFCTSVQTYRSCKANRQHSGTPGPAAPSRALSRLTSRVR